MVRDAGPVEQPGVASDPVAVHPLRQALAGDAGLGGEVRDRPVFAAADEPRLPAGVSGALRRDTRVSFWPGRVGRTSHPADRDPRPLLPTCAYRVTNLMNHNI